MTHLVAPLESRLSTAYNTCVRRRELGFGQRKSRLFVISQTAEYALRAVVFLGNQDGRPMTTQRIAASTMVPAGYLSKVLQALGKAGLVGAQRGLRGGYVLARSPEAMTMLDVVNSVDPLQRIADCPSREAPHGESLRALHRRLDEGVERVESLFRDTTIRQLVDARESEEESLGRIEGDEAGFDGRGLAPADPGPSFGADSIAPPSPREADSPDLILERSEIGRGGDAPRCLAAGA